MASNTSIEWTEHTWNPITGCTKVSPGCKRCYAEMMSMRLTNMAKHDKKPTRRHFYLPVINEKGHWNNKVQLVEQALNDPFKWDKPSHVFVNSMSDLFHKSVPLEFILKVFKVMNIANRHQFQILTKRSERLRELDSKLPWAPNIWMGVSVENEDYLYRIDDLRHTHAAVKFLSLEPLLGPLPDLNLKGIDWVIVGGESGPGARPMQIDWVRAIRDQCVREKVPFHFKQWGGMDKKAAGRILDGRTWDQMPMPTTMPPMFPKDPQASLSEDDHCRRRREAALKAWATRRKQLASSDWLAEATESLDALTEKLKGPLSDQKAPQRQAARQAFEALKSFLDALKRTR